MTAREPPRTISSIKEGRAAGVYFRFDLCAIPIEPATIDLADGTAEAFFMHYTDGVGLPQDAGKVYLVPPPCDGFGGSNSQLHWEGLHALAKGVVAGDVLLNTDRGLPLVSGFFWKDDSTDWTVPDRMIFLSAHCSECPVAK